jgi:hypothetical protein
MLQLPGHSVTVALLPYRSNGHTASTYQSIPGKHALNDNAVDVRVHTISVFEVVNPGTAVSVGSGICRDSGDVEDDAGESEGEGEGDKMGETEGQDR